MGKIGKYILTEWPVEEYDYINIKYLGTYNGYTAITLYRGSLPAIREQIIDGVLFYHPYRDDCVFAWKEGTIYELDDLSEQGLVTREDLVGMAYFHNAAQEEK